MKKHSSNASLSPTVPRTQAAFSIWRTIEIRCFKKLPARWLSWLDRAFYRDAWRTFQCSRPTNPVLQGPPVENGINCLIIRNTSIFHTLQPRLRWFLGGTRTLDLGVPCERASTTGTSHTICLPISQGIMVTTSALLSSVRYSPRASSIESKSRDLNVCFMRELTVALREKRLAVLVQKRPCKPSRSTSLPQWHVCTTQMLAASCERMEIRSCCSPSITCRALARNSIQPLRPEIAWMSVENIQTF